MVRTPDEEPWDSPKSHIGRVFWPPHASWLNSLTTAGVAKRLREEISHGVILDQYRNVGFFAVLVWFRWAKCDTDRLITLLHMNTPPDPRSSTLSSLPLQRQADLPR